MLHYDQRSRRFVGSRYLVSAADALFDRVRALCRSGQSIPDALNYLCDEQIWSLADAGREPVFTAVDLIHEAEAILAPGAARRAMTVDG